MLCLWRFKLEQRHCRSDKFRRNLIINFLTLSSPFRCAVWINHAADVWRKYTAYNLKDRKKNIFICSQNLTIEQLLQLSCFVRSCGLKSSHFQEHVWWAACSQSVFRAFPKEKFKTAQNVTMWMTFSLVYTTFPLYSAEHLEKSCT